MNKFYVYALVDPRDGHVFYVGKGSGDRASSHEGEAKRGSHKNPIVTARILAILGGGLRVQIQHLADGLSESDAFQRERQEIRARRAGLCNIAPGQLSWEERYRARIRASIARMPRYRDVPPSFRVLHKQVLKNLGRHLIMPLARVHDEDGQVTIYANLTQHQTDLMNGSTR